jgi:hypothetical protein
MRAGTFENRTSADRLQVQSLAFVMAVCVCAVLFGVFAIRASCRRPRSLPAALDFRINPNDADFASLVRLPGIGRARAVSIINYRGDLARRGKTAFSNCGDLQNVRGIGPKTVEGLVRYLRFD